MSLIQIIVMLKKGLSLLSIILMVVVYNSCVSVQKESKKSKLYDYSNYYREISKADSLFVIKEYENATQLFEEIFSKYEPINTFRFNEYSCYLKSKHFFNKDVNKGDIEALISKYGFTKGRILNDSILSKYYSQFINEEKYVELISSYKKSIDFELRKKIASMVRLDQYYRTEYDGDDFNKQLKKIDSIHERELILMFDKGVYPGEMKVGSLFYDENVPDIETLLLHTGDSVRLSYFLPKLRNFIKEGKSSPYIYAMMLDQLELYNGRTQKYGTYNVKSIDKNDIQNFSKNRKELNIGLPSIEFDIWWQKEILNR